MSASVMFNVFGGVNFVFIAFVFDLDLVSFNSDKPSSEQDSSSIVVGVEDAEIFLCLGAIVCCLVY